MADSASMPSLDSTIGLLLLTGLFSMGLWGASVVQLYYYIEKYWRLDKWHLQLYALFTWILDTVHQGILCHTVYILFVKHFADTSFLNHVPKNNQITVILQALVDTLVQVLFVTRIWYLSNKNVILTGINILLISALLTVNLIFCGKAFNFTNFGQLATLQGLIIALNTLITLVDTVIALTLVVLLRRQRSRCKATESVVKRLIMYSISTGLITGLWSLIGLAGAIALPTSNLDAFVDLVLPRLYVNCMLASLNARENLRSELASGSARGNTIQLSTFDTIARTVESTPVASDNSIKVNGTVDSLQDVEDYYPSGYPTKRAATDL
ncbi:uncharacterized protein FOMMEDRAFT_148494 [Fomitiporia mediterranea MF3/22]|uniref:uncharacterized protein n=1 Tax=Fomitiporia mediterranea (strain MF3/22) TaxID=694068 RepID=UPI0004408098|nr:uncharacterized protein FOMMEDRAFT_148494 [Fomitiporia mediterranea MF3/22]EJD00231.1 hypothetical protein FOMMEDRAFT_148494 [Fomitiporia mediterranea MF3/22]